MAKIAPELVTVAVWKVVMLMKKQIFSFGVLKCVRFLALLHFACRAY